MPEKALVEDTPPEEEEPERPLVLPEVLVPVELVRAKPGVEVLLLRFRVVILRPPLEELLLLPEEPLLIPPPDEEDIWATAGQAQTSRAAPVRVYKFSQPRRELW